MVDLFKKIQTNNSDLVSYFLSTSTKAGIQEKLQQDGFFGLAEVFKRQKFQWPVVPCGSDLERPNYVALFDLGHDPNDIFDLDTSDIYKMIQSSSKDNPIKKCQINKTIPLCSSNLIEDKNIFDIDFDLLEERARKVRENLDFQQTVSQALTDRLFNSKEPNTIEESIYAGGFPSPADDHMDTKLDLNEHLVKHPAATFFVRVTGDSMINAGIHDGDLLVVDRSLEPKIGKVVIAAVRGELTVKRYARSNGKVFFDALGHDAESFNHPKHSEIIIRAKNWITDKEKDH